ncbi:MAG: hypothetical protein MUC65_10360 [Pontiellaceae bacterium]|jgi:hypothetical protein|nr:hypothetical protein [Pontiellaceae bacterium]
MSLIFFTLVSVAIPTTWLFADLKRSPALRRTLGIIAMLWLLLMACLFGLVSGYEANWYFTSTTKDLLQISTEQIEAGNTDAVFQAWKHLDEKLHPTYENRANYRALVDSTIEEMKKGR